MSAARSFQQNKLDAVGLEYFGLFLGSQRGGRDQRTLTANYNQNVTKTYNSTTHTTRASITALAIRTAWLSGGSLTTRPSTLTTVSAFLDGKWESTAGGGILPRSL